MSVSYDIFTGAFLSKVTEYGFAQPDESESCQVIDGYMKRAIVAFKKICKYDLYSTGDDVNRVFNVDVAEDDIDELADIVSEGMLVQWMKPYLYKQENLENVLNTKDFSTYSPSELLMRIGSAYAKVQRDYANMIKDYSYNHGDLTDLHL